MAILKLGELVAGVRGTIGGTIYSANRGGPYARGWSRGPNPRSTHQQIERSYVGRMPAGWRALTDEQREDWDDYAALPAQELENSLGEAYYASGFNWYTRINTHLLNAERTVRTAPPDAGRPAIPELTELWFYIPIIDQFDVLLGFPEDEFWGFDLFIYLATHPSAGLLWKSHGYHLVYSAESPFHHFLYFGLEVLARLGQPVIGSKAFASVSKQNTQGERSAPATITSIVIAK